MKYHHVSLDGTKHDEPHMVHIFRDISVHSHPSLFFVDLLETRRLGYAPPRVLNQPFEEGFERSKVAFAKGCVRIVHLSFKTKPVLVSML